MSQTAMLAQERLDNMEPDYLPDEAESMLLSIQEAEACLRMARQMLNEGGILAARSCMTEASGWLAPDEE